MKKTKRRSRRRTALRRIFIFAVSYFLIIRLLPGIGLLLPIQAVRQSEELNGTGRTSMVMRSWAPEIHMTQLLYLSENENATCLHAPYFGFSGWTAGFSNALDCSKEASLYAGQLYLHLRSLHGNAKGTYYYFGRIDDPEIQQVEITAEYAELDENGDAQRMEGQRITIPKSSWMEKDGRWYFFAAAPEIERPEASLRYSAATGCDAEGNKLVRFDIDQSSYSYYSQSVENPEFSR